MEIYRGWGDSEGRNREDREMMAATSAIHRPSNGESPAIFLLADSEVGSWVLIGFQKLRGQRDDGSNATHRPSNGESPATRGCAAKGLGRGFLGQKSPTTVRDLEVV
ncbi:hypothetical protein Adt_27223 [Abeliophyllum distichum]|uniref:Uncharacterized protein n=1 Tax=Abeliophyllum distichum TaxID=126358 RepID=A0ABD1RT50_9LAMI